MYYVCMYVLHSSHFYTPFDVLGRCAAQSASRLKLATEPQFSRTTPPNSAAGPSMTCIPQKLQVSRKKRWLVTVSFCPGTGSLKAATLYICVSSGSPGLSSGPLAYPTGQAFPSSSGREDNLFLSSNSAAYPEALPPSLPLGFFAWLSAPGPSTELSRQLTLLPTHSPNNAETASWEEGRMSHDAPAPRALESPPPQQQQLLSSGVRSALPGTPVPRRLADHMSSSSSRMQYRSRPVSVAVDPVSLVISECIAITSAIQKHARSPHSSVSAILGGTPNPIQLGPPSSRKASPGAAANAGGGGATDGAAGDFGPSNRWGLRGKKGKSMADNPLISGFGRLRHELTGVKGK